MKKFYMRL